METRLEPVPAQPILLEQQEAQTTQQLALQPVPDVNVASQFEEDRQLAALYTSGSFQAASGLSALTKNGLDVDSLMAVLSERAEAVQQGDFTDVSDILMGQTVVLNELFCLLTMKAAEAMFAGAAQTDRMVALMGLALRSSEQLRKVTATLTDVNSPKRSSVFIAQMNHANGPQQIVNADRQADTEQQSISKISGSSKSEIELLSGGEHGQTVD